MYAKSTLLKAAKLKGVAISELNCLQDEMRRVGAAQKEGRESGQIVSNSACLKVSAQA